MIEMEKESYKSIIYGKNPIVEILSKNPKRLSKIYIQENFSFDNRLKKILTLAKENNVPISYANLQKFKKNFKEDVNFQGVLAYATEIEYMELDDFLKIKKECYKKLIVLDGISDPYNFGSIIRTAASCGMDGILISNHRSCPITPTVEKASSGAINHIPIIKTTGLSSAIDRLKREDFWVIATQMEARDNYFEIDYTDMNFAIVLGSEGSGITKTILNKADFTIKIPVKFESLNVSNAGAIIMYEALRQNYIKTLAKK